MERLCFPKSLLAGERGRGFAELISESQAYYQGANLRRDEPARNERELHPGARREPKVLRNMAQLLIQFVICALSTFATVVLTSSLLPSMFYALPKALRGCFRGAYSWKLPLFYFGSIIIWAILPGAVLSGAYYLLRWRSPETLKLVRDSWGFAGGIFAGTAIFLISRFAQSTRLGIKREFEQMALIYGRTR